MSYDLEVLQELKIPKAAEKIYLDTKPAGMSWKDGFGKYQGCCPALANMYDSSVQEMLDKTELEQKEFILESARELFLLEDRMVFKNNKKYIAFGSFQYADAYRHVCYTKEKIVDPEKNQAFVLVTGIEIPAYMMGFLVQTKNNISSQHDLNHLNQLPQNTLHFSNVNLHAEQYKINLSDREEECLFLMLRGHTAKSMASVLNLSVRTIEFHTDKLKIKLSSTRKSQLLKTAVQLGYLNLVPGRFLNGVGAHTQVRPYRVNSNGGFWPGCRVSLLHSGRGSRPRV